MEMYLLLQEYGIPSNKEDWVQEQVEQLNPIRYNDQGIAVFTSEQFAEFGPPAGFDEYEIIQLAETESPFVTDYKFDQDRCRPRPIHRYNRVERFEFILMQLLGLRGEVPAHVLAVVETYADRTPAKVWNSIRAILKHYRFHKYYNRIPFMMYQMGLPRVFEWNCNTESQQNLMTDFKKLNSVFEHCKRKYGWKRVYFPSLKFVALKLLEKHGAKCQYDIKFIRTKRKEKALNELWKQFG